MWEGVTYFRTRNRELMAQNREPRVQNREPRARNREPRAQNREPRAENKEKRAWNYRLRLKLNSKPLCTTSYNPAENVTSALGGCSTGLD